MDITATVREMNDYGEAVTYAVGRGLFVTQIDLDRLTELIDAADGWERMGGFMPADRLASVRRAARVTLVRATPYCDARRPADADAA